jgi:hypothetical protein
MYGIAKRPLQIGIDLDDTITANTDMFKEIIAVFKKYGCDVWIVTARDKDYHCEISREFEKIVDGIIFCSNKAKQDVVEIDIWIDDFPLAITHDFKEVYWIPGEEIIKQRFVKNNK